MKRSLLLVEPYASHRLLYGGLESAQAWAGVIHADPQNLRPLEVREAAQPFGSGWAGRSHAGHGGQGVLDGRDTALVDVTQELERQVDARWSDPAHAMRRKLGSQAVLKR